MNNKRIIKTELITGNEIMTVPLNNQALHPVSSEWINNNNQVNPICLTKYQINNNKVSTYKNYSCKTKINNYSNYLYIPPIGLSSQDIINVYNIDSIDKLNNWINENIDGNYITLNRCLNCWIRINYETLQNYNNFLEKIVNKIVIKYYEVEIKKINNLDKEIKSFIDYWINKNNPTVANLDLIYDFINYIRKKYK
jgi:hypothetical protein